MASSDTSAAADDENKPTPREQRAGRVAASQGLVLCRSAVQCGVDYACRYDLLYERYAQPAALNLKLPAIEAWLGIKTTTRH